RPIDVYRRNLQKAYVERLCALVGPATKVNRGDDALSLLKAHARELDATLKSAAARSTDALTRDHLVDLGERLDLALKPKS
ncbi:MAG TPA: hypothetical protein VL547_10765, partial [Dinghuibacter sp.]|uniref:hypothetical protein n=1 Tax=Dinghuibacter sp. TaxID=2024697 RepID=UPI002BFA5E16